VIHLLRPEFSLSQHRMAQILGVPRSLLYHKHAPPKEAALLGKVQELVLRFMGYGYRRVLLALQAEGFEISQYKVRKIMREHGLRARRPRNQSRPKTDSKSSRMGNLFRREMPAECNKIWVADTTQLVAGKQLLYLAAVLDLHSRKVIGWSLSRRNDEALVLECLRSALETRRPPVGWIHHSDRGSTYLAGGYCGLIRQMGGLQSLSAPGRPTDNPHMESFFSTLKKEEIHLNQYDSFLEAKTSIETFIEHIYNQERIHSSLGYISPVQFESRLNGEKR
jgi:putative transposase